MNNTFYKENNLSGLKRADFQKIVDGKETDLFILSNQQGAEVAITNYEMCIRDRVMSGTASMGNVSIE